MPDRDTALLEVRGLRKYFPARTSLFGRPRAWVRAVDGVDLTIRPGETFGLLGESGCGKSTLARVIVRLLPPTAGRVLFEGEDVTDGDGPTLRQFRRSVQLVFQDPFASLNPRMTVEAILTEGLRAFEGLNRKQRRQRAAELLEQVGLERRHLSRYPHEFSGGQRQRIGIARALALRPKLIIADEPVSALDVSVQAQILNLLMDLKERTGLSYLLIAHDPEVIRVMSDRVAVMYLGRIVEIGDARHVLGAPAHPYTEALLAAAPKPIPGKKREKRPLSGDVPSPLEVPPGCAFHPRCPRAVPRCREQRPELKRLPDGRQVACWLAE